MAIFALVVYIVKDVGHRAVSQKMFYFTVWWQNSTFQHEKLCSKLPIIICVKNNKNTVCCLDISKILDKSDVMPLGPWTLSGLPDLMSKFKWKPEGFKHIGVWISKDINKIYKPNLQPLKERLKTDLEGWKILPILLTGRVNIKMCCQSVFTYSNLSHWNVLPNGLWRSTR